MNQFSKMFGLVSFVFASTLVACTFNTNNAYEFPAPPSASSTVPSTTPTNDAQPQSDAGQPETTPVDDSGVSDSGTTDTGTDSNDDDVATDSGTADVGTDTGSDASDAGADTATCPAPTTKLSITLDPSTPHSAIVVGGKSSWNVFSQYLVKNLTTETQSIWQGEVAQTDPNGDAADFEAVDLGTAGSASWLAASSSFKTSSGEEHFKPTQVAAMTPPISIAAGETKTIQVFGWMSNVLSSSAAGGAWHGVARSGHSDALRLVNLRVLSDPSCNVQAADPSNPPSMVLRKSQPIITKQPLSTTTLANIDQDLFKFQIAADSAGSVALKQFVFLVNRTNVTLKNLRLRRGNIDIDPTTYSIADQGVEVDVIFAGEETISGSGNVYTLHAEVSGVMSGSSVTAKFFEPFSQVITGSLEKPLGPRVSINDGGFVWLEQYFVWSDLSEPFHSSVLGSSSSDWTQGHLVQDLSQVQRLSL